MYHMTCDVVEKGAVRYCNKMLPFDKSTENHKQYVQNSKQKRQRTLNKSHQKRDTYYFNAFVVIRLDDTSDDISQMV